MPFLPRSVAVILIAALIVFGFLYARSGRDGGAEDARDGVDVSVDRSRIVGESSLTLGVTHTQYSLDSWGDPAAVERGRALLRRLGPLQNQHIYGFGVVNPEPRPGVFDWKRLDARVALMRSTGATPVITLCCAPDWMTRLGTPTSRYPYLPPTPDHVDDFARLAATVARRYPDVRHYMVWNELKGFYDDALGRWDVEAYTQLYNAVYAALKAVDPKLQVGGPYLVIHGTGSTQLGHRGSETEPPITPGDRHVLEYWLAHATGADFVVVDRAVQSFHDRNGYAPAEYLELTRWFEDVTRQVRRLTALPVWFAEDYFRDDPDWRFQAAGLASMLAAELRGGAAVSLRWGPQGTGDAVARGNPQSLFSDTQRPDGGRPYPAFFVYELFARRFPPGTPLVRATSASPARLGVLASPDVTVLINRRPNALAVALDGRSLRLAPYEVRAVPVAS